MLAPQTIERGLAEIDPAERALLELAYRRGLSDAEIASLSGSEAAQVSDRRARAEAALAAVLGSDRAQVRAALGGDAGRGARRSRRLLAVGGGLAIALAVALVLALRGGGGDGDGAGANGAASTDNPVLSGTATGTGGGRAPIRHGPRLAFERLNGTNGRGTAQLSVAQGSVRVRVRVRDFLTPRGGGYAVWLYNSPQDARGLAATARTAFDLSLLLPRDYRRYRFIDISREADTRPAHSGLSLLRVDLRRLAPAG